MDKTKNNKTEKLLNEITGAFDVLRNSLSAFDAFKIVFALLHYKRFNDIIENCEGFEEFGNLISPEDLLPEEYRWQRLHETPAERLFVQIDASLDNIYNFNDRRGGFDEPIDIKKYRTKITPATQKELIDIFSSHGLTLKDLSHEEFEAVVWEFETKYLRAEGKEARDKISCTPPSLRKLMMKLVRFHQRERVYIPFCGSGDIFVSAIDHTYDDLDSSFGSNHIFMYLNEENRELIALLELRFSTAVAGNISAIELLHKSRYAEILLYSISCSGQNLYESGWDDNRTTKADVIFLPLSFGLRRLEKLPSKVSVDGTLLETPQDHGELSELLYALHKLSDTARMSVVLPLETLAGKGKIRSMKK